ncbi:MAG: cytochrome c3 family protein [Thermodesulfovibrionia bacterium]|nr:cytochrome c3 family protein [Thermodesulfovibrionia bacterium]
MKRLLHIMFLILFFIGLTFTGLTLAQIGGGVKKKRPLPHEYGRVIIDNYKELWYPVHLKEPSAPVVFDHWLHRARFTCRLCHIDIAFAMEASATGIRASDNKKGYYCGTCHNGKMVYNDREVFASCSKNFQEEDVKRCVRCHSLGKNVKREYDFYTFTEKLPRGRFGNGIDWEKAEAEGLIKPIDFLEGVSIRSFQLEAPKDFDLEAKVEGIPNIIFSHKKHTVWNGCEVCHPEIFIGVKKGITKFTCVNNFEGKYCGACHRTVAFPMLDCQRCHIKAVQ